MADATEVVRIHIGQVQHFTRTIKKHADGASESCRIQECACAAIIAAEIIESGLGFCFPKRIFCLCNSTIFGIVQCR